MANPLNQYSPMQSALALLQPTVSYAQKRADADRNLMLQSAITQQSQQEIEMAKQQALLLQQQRAQLASVPFLPKDVERWQIELDKLKAKIRERVENDFGGDHEAYARTMLDQDMQNLALDAQRSPLFAGGLQRRQNFLQAQEDAKAGKIYRSVQYKLTNGETKVAPWEKAYLDFSNGDTEELPYNGGYKVEGKWRKAISDQYSPRVDKLGKYRTDFATPGEVLSAITTVEGLSGQDAAEYYGRTAPLLGNIAYKVDPRDPYREEQLKQGWANVGLGKERNAIARDRNKIAHQQAAQQAQAGHLDWWDATFNNPDNIITRSNGQPSTVNVSLFDANMNPSGSGKLQGFTGKVIGPTLLESTGATYDKKLGAYRGAGGEAYVKVKNSSGGEDLRATDLTGLNYFTKPGNVYRYETAPTEYEKSTGRKPYKYLQEQTIIISSDEAKKAQNGALFRGFMDYPGRTGPLGNLDSPTGKGAYTPITIETGKEGKKYYQFKVLQPVTPTMIDRLQPTLERMNTQTKTGQAAMNDTDDDMSYY